MSPGKWRPLLLGPNVLISMVIDMVAGDLTPQGVSTSSVTVLIYLSRNIPVQYQWVNTDVIFHTFDMKSVY